MADTEAVHDGELAGINDETPGLHGGVEAFEGEGGMGGTKERGDDRRLPAVIEERLKTQRAKPAHDGVAVGLIACEAGRAAAFGVVEVERFEERGDGVGGWGELCE